MSDSVISDLLHNIENRLLNLCTIEPIIIINKVSDNDVVKKYICYEKSSSGAFTYTNQDEISQMLEQCHGD